MNGSTHIIIGMASSLVLAHNDAIALDNPLWAGMMLAGVVGSIMPDIDHPNSIISRNIRPARLLFRWFRHRGFTHSLLGAFIVTMIASQILPYPVALALAGGYVWHIAADFVTVSGVQFLWPMDVTFRLGVMRTGGLIERGIALAVGVFALWLLWVRLMI